VFAGGGFEGDVQPAIRDRLGVLLRRRGTLRTLRYARALDGRRAVLPGGDAGVSEGQSDGENGCGDEDGEGRLAISSEELNLKARVGRGVRDKLREELWATVVRQGREKVDDQK
jgi:hypothetical protein